MPNARARRRRIGHQRVLGSAALALLHLALAAAYAYGWARSSTPPPTDGRRISVVSYIDSLGPVWQLGFGLTGTVLAAGLIVARPRVLSIAHTIAAAAATTYAAGLWVGYVLSDPRPSIVTALGYTATVVWHVTIGVTYSRLTPPRDVASGGAHRRGR